jgi:hypothetical protein
LEQYHKYEENFHVVCQAPGCENVYENFEGFKSHLRRKHAHILNRIIDSENNIPPVIPPNDERPHDPSLSGDDEEAGNPNAGDNHPCINRDITRESNGLKEEDIARLNACYLLATKEIHKLNKKTVNTIVTNTTSIVQNSLELVRGRVSSMLDNCGAGCTNIQELREQLNDLLTEENVMTNPFLGMETKCQQDQIFRDMFGVVVSVPNRYSIQSKMYHTVKLMYAH